MLIRVAQIITAAHTESRNLACADTLMNHDRTTKRGHPDLFYWVLGHYRKYLYVYYLCTLLTYSHNIVGVNRHFQASWASQPTVTGTCILQLCNWLLPLHLCVPFKYMSTWLNTVQFQKLYLIDLTKKHCSKILNISYHIMWIYSAPIT